MAETTMISMPADRSLENGILAAAICGKIVKPLSGMFNESDFYFDDSRELFKLLLEIEKKDRITFDIVFREVEIRKKSGLYVPPIEMHSFIGGVDWHVDKLREFSRRRELIKHAYHLQQRAMDMDQDVTTAEAEMTFVMLNRDNQRHGLRHISEILPEALADLEKFARREKTGFSFGFQSIDQITGGMEYGDYVIIAGRPSTGKTTLAINIGINLANSGVPVYLFEIEMRPKKIVLRIMSGRAGVNLFSIKNRGFNGDEQQRMMNAIDTKGFDFLITNAYDFTPDKIRAAVHQQCAKYGKGVVIIDYIQIMKSDRKRESKVLEVSDISQGIKAIATDTGCPVIALSQLSREKEKRQGPPLLSDLRDSGSLEQDADAVLMLDNTVNDLIDIYVAKSREGPTGKITMKYEKMYHRFSEPTAPVNDRTEF